MKSKIITLLAVHAAFLGGLFIFPACATTGTGQQKIVAKLAVQYAVLKVAEKNPAKVARIVAIAREVQAVAGSEGADTVDLLVALIRARVDFSKLDAADTLLAHALIDTIGEQLKERVGSGTIAADRLPAVAEIARWVIESAAPLAPPAAP